MSNQTLRRITLALLTAASAAQAQEVIPDFYKEPGISQTVTRSIKANTKALTPSPGRYSATMSTSGFQAMAAWISKVIRSYNSSNVDPGNARQPRTTAGWGWTIHFGRILKARESFPCLNKNTETVADNPVLELPDGSRQLLTFTGPTSPVMALTTQRWKADLHRRCWPARHLARGD